MTLEQIQLLRRLALNDEEIVARAMAGDLDEFQSLDARAAALVRLAALVGIAPDESSYRWAVDRAMAAGVEDEEMFHALIVIAPVVGAAKTTSALTQMMAALDLDVVED